MLLSRPIPQIMAFNLEAHLARVRSVFHDSDFSDIGFTLITIWPARPLTRSPLARLRHGSQKASRSVSFVDEPPETISADIEKWNLDISGILDDCVDAWSHCVDTVRMSFDVMMLDATTQGIDSSHITYFRSLLHDYRYAFLLGLGADPPVDVPPMKIRLTSLAISVRVKSRRYTQEQATFLRDEVM